MGDFLQIISFTQHDDEKSRGAGMSCFVTAYLLCGKIASLLTPYVITELNIKDNFAEISMFFSGIKAQQIRATPNSPKYY